MTDKELRHLNRSELLQMLIMQGEENRKLKEQLEEAQKKLEQREIVMKNAGSIAEASLQLSGVFEAAEKAAQQYINSVKNYCGEKDGCMQLTESSDISSNSEEQAVSSTIKADNMSSDEYWQQVQKRAQLLLGNNL